MSGAHGGREQSRVLCMVSDYPSEAMGGVVDQGMGLGRFGRPVGDIETSYNLTRSY